MSPEEHNAVRRSNWRNAFAWSLRRPYRAVFIVVLLAFAGAGSIFGVLRWQLPLLRWSFAAICWLAAIALLIGLVAKGRKEE